MRPTRDQGHPPTRASAESGPVEYSLSGKAVRCPHCAGTLFKAGEARLNTALATLLGLDWTGRSA